MEPGYTLLEEEQELDLKDMLASILLRWKSIFLGIIIGMIVFGAIGFVKSGKEKTEDQVPVADQVKVAREALSETEAAEADRVYAQYQVYQNYILNLGQFSSVYNSDKKMKIVKYYIVSSMKNVETLFSNMALSSEDYERISQVTGDKDKKSGSSLKDNYFPVQFYSSFNWDNSNYIAENDKNNLSKEATLITVFIFADTEKQCDAMQEIVGDAFEREAKLLSEMDQDILCRLVDARYSSDVRDYSRTVEKDNIDRLDIVNNALATLKNYFINNFTSDQKNYFELLKTQGMEEAETGEQNKDAVGSVNLKTIIKYLLLGAVVGCFLVGGWLLVSYILDDHIKTSDDLEYFGVPVLDTVYYEGDHNLMTPAARKITGAYPTDAALQEHMLAEDISILMGEDKKLYFLFCSDCEEDVKLADQLKKFLDNRDIEIRSGNLTHDPKELKLLSEADHIFLIAHLKRTKSETIKRMVEISSRYGKHVEGAIIIGLC